MKEMKQKSLLPSILLMAMCLVLTACHDDTIEGPTITLNKHNLLLEIDGSERLEASFDPYDTSNTGHTWTSSNPNVASVDETGMVKGIALGETEIMVRAMDGGKTDRCAVKVIEKIIYVTGVSLQSTATIKEGETLQLTATVKPTNATDQKVNWTSNDETVLTVDDNGLVKGIKEGSATVTVTTNDGNKTAKCIVTVEYNGVKVTGVSLNQTSANVAINDTIHLIARVSPSDATNTKVSWSSSDNTIAAVNEEGVVTGWSEGKVTITVTTEYGQKTAKCDVTVKQPVVLSGLSFSEITNQSATVSGKFEFTGVTPKEYGCQYSTNSSITGNDVKIAFDKNNTDGVLTGLKQNTTYYVRLYAVVGNEYTYSEVKSFKTKGELKTDFALTDVYIGALKMESPLCEGYGDVKVCYGTSPSPKVTNRTATAKVSNNKLVLDLSGLAQGGKYYIRSYQEVGGKIEYSDDEKCFETIGSLNSNCEVNCSFEFIGQTSTPYILWYYSATIDYKIRFNYKLKSDALYKLSVTNCKLYYSTSEYLESGEGSLDLYRQFNVSPWSDETAVISLIEKGAASLTLVNTSTNVKYHFVVPTHYYSFSVKCSDNQVHSWGRNVFDQ